MRFSAEDQMIESYLVYLFIETTIKFLTCFLWILFYASDNRHQLICGLSQTISTVYQLLLLYRVSHNYRNMLNLIYYNSLNSLSTYFNFFCANTIKHLKHGLFYNFSWKNAFFYLEIDLLFAYIVKCLVKTFHTSCFFWSV